MLDKKKAMASDALQNAIADVKAALEGSGRVLVRPSGTEPVIRIIVESQDEAQAIEMADRLEEVLHSL